MSSSTTTTIMDRLTYWCHECDMSISLLSPSTPFLCPHCHTDFLEQMDSSPNPNPNPNPNRSPNDNGNLLLSSPYHRRLIHLISTSDPTTTTQPTPTSTHHTPTSKLTLSNLPTLTITESFLQTTDDDPIILCAVCKDQFFITNQVMKLPCNHLFHQDCIFPWLQARNTCPLCRFTLPVEEEEEGERTRTESFGRARMEGYEEFFEAWSNLSNDTTDTRMVFSVGPREEGIGVDEVVGGSGDGEIGGVDDGVV